MTDETEGEGLAEPFKAMEPIKDTPIAPAHGIAALALSLALKYCDISTVQDGVLYQQYKMEGKNLNPLHLDYVFEVAIKIEAHLLAGSSRIAQIVVDALEEGMKEDEGKPATPDKEAPP